MNKKGRTLRAKKAPGNAPASGPSQVTVIIETPRGSRNKLKYDPDKRMYRLSKVMPEGMVFPYDFGFVPGTKADDGDPMDILVLTDEPLFPGCLVDCVLVGVIEVEQQTDGAMKRNDRLIAVARASLLYSEVKDLADLNPTVEKQIEAFFVNYQKVRNVGVKILARGGADKAVAALHRSGNRNVAA